MIRYFFIYLAVINLIAFGLFAVDKKRAVYNGEIAGEGAYDPIFLHLFSGH